MSASRRRRAPVPFLTTVGFFVLVVGLAHFRFEEAHPLYCEDIGRSFLARTSYTHQHPWEAFRGEPTPSSIFGTTNYLTDGGPAVVLPLLASLKARLAPTRPAALMRFEWRITGLYLLVSMAGLFVLLRLAEVPLSLAAGVASSLPFVYTFFFEWRHVDLTRGRLMISLVLLALFLAVRRWSYAAWLGLAVAVIASMAQATQLYFVAILVILWMASSAVVERRRLFQVIEEERIWCLRHIGPPLVAFAVVAVALLPMYLRGQAAIAESAFQYLLASDPGRLLAYFEHGREWFSFASLLAPPRGFLPWSVAGLCLGAGVFALRRLRLVEGCSSRPIPGLRLLLLLGLVLFPLMLASSFVPDSPWEIFVVRDGRLEWSFLPLGAPTFAALLFHTTQRTWLVLAEVGALLAGVSLLAAWSRSPLGAGKRFAQGAAALVFYFVLLLGARWISGSPGGAWQPIGGALLISAILVAVGLASSSGAWGALGKAALPCLGLWIAWTASSHHLEAGMAQCRGGAEDAALSLARDEALLARVPDEVRAQREFRLHGEKWCYWLDAPCGLSYGLRAMPWEVLRFFEATGSVRDVNLPYWLLLDYPRLLELGLAQMLGIRWWILPGELVSGGIPLSPEEDPLDLHFFEVEGAFPKGWLLPSWETAASYEEAAARVALLGAQGRLGSHGVVPSGTPGPPVSPEAPGEELLRAQLTTTRPGSFTFRVASSRSAVLATNEFFHPDWRAVVDGSPRPVLRVNASFAGVLVGPGDEQVVLSR